MDDVDYPELRALLKRLPPDEDESAHQRMYELCAKMSEPPDR